MQNLRCRSTELKSEDAPSGTGRRRLPDSECMFYRRSPGNPFDCARRSVRGLAFGSHMGSSEASFLFYLSVLPLLLPLLLCVGLWSPKVLESEWASNNSRPGSSAGLFGWQPTVPSSMHLMDSFRRGSASVAARHRAFVWLNSLIVKGWEQNWRHQWPWSSGAGRSFKMQTFSFVFVL